MSNSVKCNSLEESAAACLVYIGQKHDLNINLKKFKSITLENSLELNSTGEIIVSGRQIGLNCTPLEGEFSELHTVERPNIIKLQENDVIRYVVLKTINYPVGVLVFDPIIGTDRFIESADFIKIWTGDCISTSKVEGEFNKIKAELSKSILQKISSIFKPSVSKVLYLLISSITTICCIVQHTNIAIVSLISLALLSSLWSVLFSESCKQCSKLKKTAGVIPLDTVGTILYLFLLCSISLIDINYTALILSTAAGAHIYLLYLIKKTKLRCISCIITGLSAITAAIILAAIIQYIIIYTALMIISGYIFMYIILPVSRKILYSKKMLRSREVISNISKSNLDKITVIVFKETGCPACMFYDAVIKPALVQDFGDEIIIDERVDTKLGTFIPLIIVSKSTTTAFLGIQSDDSTYDKVLSAIQIANNPSTPGTFTIVE